MTLALHRSRLGASLLCVVSLAWAHIAAGQPTRLSDYGTPAYLEFSDPQYQVAEDETNAVITVVRTGEYRQPASVDYTSENGTAQAGQDYSAASGTLLIPAGVGYATFSVPIHRDDSVEAPKTVLLKLSNPGFNTMITRASATLTITDPPLETSANALALTVKCSSSDHVTVSWPTAGKDCRLEKSANPGGPNWVEVNAPREIADGTCAVTERLSSGQSFYRLRSP